MKEYSEQNSLHRVEDSGHMISRDDALLDIFTEENLHCHNLREMDTAISRCFNALQFEAQENARIIPHATPELLQIIGAYLRGKEIRSADATLIADLDKLPKSVLQKIKDGTYKIAQSKQIDGNFRPVVVDKNGKIIKQVTLKGTPGDKVRAGDVNTMAIQAALKEITQQLKVIDADVQYLITLNRRENFQTPYFDAVSDVREAQGAKTEEERGEAIKSAIDHLKHGLNGLYGDLDDCLKTLQGRWLPIASKRNLDRIAEDVVYIPHYVALLAYLYNYRGRQDLGKTVLADYQKEINRFMDKSIAKDGYTAAQLVHSHYQYIEANKDFWIDGMRNIQSAITSIEWRPSNKKTIYFISFDDTK